MRKRKNMQLIIKLPPVKKKKVLFLHGIFGYQSRKPIVMSSLGGYEVITPKLSDWLFESAKQTAQRAYDEHLPDAIVGSSRGAAIAMQLDFRDRNVPLVLLSPAWKLYRCNPTSILENPCTILHSKKDFFIPIVDSMELAHQSNSKLITVGENHRMNDSKALNALLNSLGNLLNNPL